MTDDSSAETRPAAEQVSELPEALVAALVEIEQYVGQSGWDQPARLFALVRTADLVAAEPQLAEQLTVTSDDALSSIEQEDFRDGEDLFETLSRIGWSDDVHGCALSLERSFLPAGLEDQIPAHPDDAARFVANHPQHQDVRVVVGALRDGSTHGLARLVTQPDELLGGHDLVPGLSRVLAETLR
ncbi:PPA1309 family protein [Luteococcus sp. Sow4_B9]|uniref:PPA1309 family protein n=1 Tax=Luteococcus sp. Sow4_B9 TaxID=3438792 RepID=UPI003F997D3F